MRQYLLEAILGFITIVLAILFYVFTKEIALALVLGVLFGALAVYAGIIKHGVDVLLRKTITLYELRSMITSSLLRMKADEIIATCVKQLKQLTEGYYNLEGIELAFSEVRYVYDTAKQGESIRSVVLVSHATILLGLYLNIHQNTVKRGVHIIKIFIIGNDELVERLKEFCAFSNVGVDVRFVSKEELSIDPRLISDFLISDKCVIASELDSNGQLSGVRVSTRDEDLSNYFKKFDELYSISKPLEAEGR